MDEKTKEGIDITFSYQLKNRENYSFSCQIRVPNFFSGKYMALQNNDENTCFNNVDDLTSALDEFFKNTLEKHNNYNSITYQNNFPKKERKTINEIIDKYF